MSSVKSEPLVSVVIATFNMGAYLPAAIDSILSQTYRNFEIIVVDDGSTDDTSAQVRRYLALPNFRYQQQANCGQPKAKNTGIQLCRGELVAFCDADDLWSHKKLELQVPCFREVPDLAVVSTEISQIDADGNCIGGRKVGRHSGRILEKLLLKNCISFGTAIVRRDVLIEMGGFDESLPMGIDWDLWLRIAVKYEFLHLEDVTYFYRIWPGQMSRNYRGRYQNAFRILDKFFEMHPTKVSSTIRRAAYADTYVERARIVHAREGRILEPLLDCVTALRLCPTYLAAWKSLARLMLPRR